MRLSLESIFTERAILNGPLVVFFIGITISLLSRCCCSLNCFSNCLRKILSGLFCSSSQGEVEVCSSGRKVSPRIRIDVQGFELFAVRVHDKGHARKRTREDEGNEGIMPLTREIVCCVPNHFQLSLRQFCSRSV